MYESEGGDYLASIKEVAQKAGVGVGTVSRFLNSTGYVSDETRIKVETAMKELNYTSCKSGISGQVCTIRIVIDR